MVMNRLRSVLRKEIVVRMLKKIITKLPGDFELPHIHVCFFSLSPPPLLLLPYFVHVMNKVKHVYYKIPPHAHHATHSIKYLETTKIHAFIASNEFKGDRRKTARARPRSPQHDAKLLTCTCTAREVASLCILSVVRVVSVVTHRSYYIYLIIFSSCGSR